MKSGPFSRTQINRPLQPPAFPVALAYGALVLLFFAPHLLGLTAFPDSDFTRHFLPFSLFQQSAILELRLPLWDPHTFSGHPFLADAQSAVFYPVSNALLVLTSFDRSPAGRLYWLQVEAGLHIFLACLFTYMLVRRLTGSRMAAFTAGAVFGFSGYLTGYVPVQLGILRVAVWLPAILLLLLPGAARTGTASSQCSADAVNAPPAATGPGRLFPQWKRWLAAAAVQAVAFFGGHPQTFLFLSYAVGGWMLMLFVSDLRSQRVSGSAGKALFRALSMRALLYAGMVTAYVAVLVVLTLAQLWPIYEYLQHTVRASLSFQEASGGFPFRDTLQFLLPGLLTLYSPQYVGVVVLGLAFVAVAALFTSGFSLPGAGPHARPAAFFFVICGAAALLLSYGGRIPLYSLYFRFMPGGELFRGQERAIYLVAFSLSVLSGYGMALLPTLTPRQRRTLCWGFAAAVAASLALFGLWRQLPARADIATSALLRPSAMALLIAFIFAILTGPRLGRGKWLSGKPVARTRLIALIPLALLDLFVVNFVTNWSFGPAVRAGLAPSEAAAVLEASRSLAAGSNSLPPRVYNEHRVSRNSGLLLGWEDVLGKSPLRHAKYNALITDLPLDRMWELTGTGTVLTWRHELPVDSRLVAEFPQPQRSRTYLHVLNSVTPRLWWTQRARSVNDEEALALLADPAFNIRDELLIALSDAEALGSAWQAGRMILGDGGQADLQVERVAAGHLRIGIESAQRGFLFLSEKWLPGWQALWQGEHSLPVARANRAFLAIPVPAGSGTLELVYRPRSAVWGLAASVVGWVGLFIVLRFQLMAAARTAWRRAHDAFNQRKRKPPQPAAPQFGRENVQLAGRRMLSNELLQRGALLAIILAGFLLRLFRLAFRELRGDESFGFFFSLSSPGQIVARTLALQEPHPVGSYLLQHAWLQVAGTHEFALRFIPVFAGTAAIPLVFHLGKQLRLGAPAALTASLFLAVNAYAIWHSQDARMYSLSLALTVAATILALRVIRLPKSWRAPAGYAVCAAAVLNVHYYAAFIILAHNFFVLFLLLRGIWMRRSQRRAGQLSETGPSGDRALIMRWSFAQLLTLALCAPWFVIAWQTLVGYGGNGDSPAFGPMLWRSLGVFTLGETVPHPIWRFAGGLLAGSVIVAGIALSLRNKDSVEDSSGTLAGNGPKSQIDGESRIGPEDQQQSLSGQPSVTLFLLLYLLIPLLATWISSRQRPIFDERYLAAALPPFLLLIAVSAARMSSWVDTHLRWRWRFWVDGDAGAPSAPDYAAHRSSLLARIPLGRISAAALVLLVVAANVYSLQNHYSGSTSLGWRALAGTLDRWSAGLPADDVRIAANFPDPTLSYYYKGDVQQFMIPPRPHDADGAAEVVDFQIRNDVFRIILPVSPAPNWDAAGIAPNALAAGFQKVLQEQVGIFPVHLYTRPDPQSWRNVGALFVNGVTLERAQLSPETLTPGGVLVVHMDWRGDQATLTGGEKIFVHLINEDGGILSQADPILQLNSAEGFTSLGLRLPAELPPGPLRLITGLYDASLEGAPKTVTENGMDSVVLSEFEIEATEK
ncbi:MAG: glycosyltransferase family 39 protein [Caldilineaceae bacterium]|nr:glycosyltransferase family 39 protein [Caldilineaceae bacterium]